MNLEEKIKRVIEKTGLSRDEIKKQIDQEINALSGLIDEEAAIIIVMKRLGIDLKEQQQSANMEVDRMIKTLQTNNNASIVGRIIDITGLKSYKNKEGREGNLFSFFLEDKTGKIRCTVWDQNTPILNEAGFAKNQVVRVVNGQVKDSKFGGLEIHVGSKSRIQVNPDQVDATLIPAKTSDTTRILPINQITLNEINVSVEGAVSMVYPPKEFESKTGKKGSRAALILNDKTGSTSITFWNQDGQKIINLKTGQTVKILNLSPKINFKDKSKIDLIASEKTEITVLAQGVPGIDATKEGGAQPVTPIKDFIDRNAIATIEGKVIDLGNVKKVNLKDGTQKDVQPIVLADTTGSISMNLWGDQVIQNLRVNDVLHIENARVKMNNYSGKPEANISRDGSVKKIEKAIEVSLEVQKDIASAAKPTPEKLAPDKGLISSITEVQKPEFYTIKATIVKDIKQITLYQGCSKCLKKLDNCQCSPKGTTVNRLILNLLLEDESGAIRGTLIGDGAEKIIGQTTDNLKSMSDNGTLSEFLKEKTTQFLGKEYIFRGKAKYSSYSQNFELTINSFEEINPEKETQLLMKILTPSE